MKMLAVKNFFSSSIIYYNLLQTPNWVCHHHLLSLVIVFTWVLFWFQSFSSCLNFSKFYCTGCPKSSFLLLIKTLFLHKISRRYIFLSQVHVFRISITGMPFFFLKWDAACRPTNDPFWTFLSPGAQDTVQSPNNICLV